MLEIDSLTRRFGDNVAVDNVSFDVPEGHMIGFVGGNGAGKTTTMRMIMGLLARHGGEVRWQGRPITADDIRRFGYMPEERGLYPKQGILDQLVYLARLHDAKPADARTEAMELLERFGLGDRAKDKLESLSLGNQQRVQIAAAVMTQPIALVLDEPFSGLDPKAIDAMADLLRGQSAKGVPVLFSSHQLDLIDRLCDGLVILSNGRVVANGTREQLQHTGRVRHRIVLDGDAGWVRGIPGVVAEDVDGPVAIVEFVEAQAQHRVLEEAVRRGTVRELAELRPSLSEIYREVTA
ncbi:MAG: ATP-binding cassette domain-containing protein [Micrococcales bacterium]|nr:ATP-binding cassette domain-containing protein [Micrococcales bacterium]